MAISALPIKKRLLGSGFFLILAIHLIFNSFHTSSQGSNVQRPEWIGFDEQHSALMAIFSRSQLTDISKMLWISDLIQIHNSFSKGGACNSNRILLDISFVIAPIFIYSIGVNELHDDPSGLFFSWMRVNSSIHRFIDSWMLAVGLAGWLVGLLAGWLARWLARWLVDWLAGWLAHWLVGGLVGWLVGWLVCLWVNWLSGWLAGHRLQAADEEEGGWAAKRCNTL